jgi:hypothetical protein
MKSLSAVVAIGYYPAFAAASAEYAGEVCSLRQFINWQNQGAEVREQGAGSREQGAEVGGRRSQNLFSLIFYFYL